MTSEKKQSMMILLVAVIVFIGIQYALYNQIVLSKGVEVIGTDTFMRLVRVEALHDTGAWYDSMVQRNNAPYGDELHWTRSLDIILYIPAFISQIWTDFSIGLYTWGIWLGPVFGSLALMLLFKVPDHLVALKTKPYLFLLFMTQPVTLEMFKFGRPDHHSLMLVVFLVWLNLVLKSLLSEMRKREYIAIAVIMAMAIWISVESLILVGLYFLTQGLIWIIDDADELDNSIFVASVLTVMASFFNIVEKPLNDFFRLEYDKISIVYIALFLVITCVLYVTKKMLSNGPSWLVERRTKAFFKGMVLGLNGIVGILLLVIILPDFLGGPFTNVNPAIKPIWLDLVLEVQPLLEWTQIGLGKMIMYLGLPVLSTVYLMYELGLKSKEKWRPYLFLLFSLMIYGLLSCYQIRWIGYLQLVALVPSAMFLNHLMGLCVASFSDKWMPLIRNVIIVLFLFGFTILGAFMIVNQEPKSASMKTQYSVKIFSNWFNDEMGPQNNKIVLAFLDFGPELLYRTDLSVVSAPYHRNDEGILYNYDVMTSKDINKAKKMLMTREISWILLAPETAEVNFYDYTKGNDTFYDQLLNQPLPKWLTEIDLPYEIEEMRLYKVDLK